MIGHFSIIGSVSEVESRTSRNGLEYCIAKIAHGEQRVDVVCFQDAHKCLANCESGDGVAMSGVLEAEVKTTQQGGSFTNWKPVANKAERIYVANKATVTKEDSNLPF